MTSYDIDKMEEGIKEAKEKIERARLELESYIERRMKINYEVEHEKEYKEND